MYKYVHMGHTCTRETWCRRRFFVTERAEGNSRPSEVRIGRGSVPPKFCRRSGRSQKHAHMCVRARGSRKVRVWAHLWAAPGAVDPSPSSQKQACKSKSQQTSSINSERTYF